MLVPALFLFVLQPMVELGTVRAVWLNLVFALAVGLAGSEALAGQLFLAILVARLVAMEIEWCHDQREARLRDRNHEAPAKDSEY